MKHDNPITRRHILQTLGGIGIGTLVFQRALATAVQDAAQVTSEMVAQAEWIAGIELPAEAREEVAESLSNAMAAGRRLRELPVDADVGPANVFRPDFFYSLASEEGSDQEDSPAKVEWQSQPGLLRQDVAATDADLAFASISTQASLLANKQLSSLELTKLYLGRLERYDPQLRCVVTSLAETALEAATEADRRRASGNVRGPLDGIPWVAKDLIAVPPWKTTWGAEPFREQVRAPIATVAERLQAAGAVLLAKVSLGALAWGDQWFEGTTRNPWNVEQGSSGSSAGSAAAVAAGLTSFALGSETLGSIISPTRRCRTCGLRPTFGRVSRAGCMPLAWSMDKIGPIARYVEDLALVLGPLLGRDGRDPTVANAPFAWPESRALNSITIGVTGDQLSEIESQALELLKSEGAKVVELSISTDLPVDSMNFILGVEATSVFEDAYREDQTADYGLWSSTFRSSALIPAVQYLRANRIRGQLIIETEKKFRSVDVILGGNDLLLTNLTGHPSLNVVCGSENDQENPRPGIVKLTAAAYRESLLLQVGAELQRLLPAAPSRPTLFADA